MEHQQKMSGGSLLDLQASTGRVGEFNTSAKGLVKVAGYRKENDITELPKLDISTRSLSGKLSEQPDTETEATANTPLQRTSSSRALLRKF